MSDLGFPLRPTLARWRESAHGRRHASAVESFLRSFSSPHTRRAYGYAIEELWDWYAWTHDGASPTPDQLVRDDAWAFLEHLRTRPAAFTEYRVAMRFPNDLTLYDAVKTHPGSTAEQLSDRMGRDVGEGLSRLLSADILVRHPALSEVRHEGRDLLAQDPPDGFRYYLDAKVAGTSPSTLWSRLTALSGLWSFLAETGENTGEAPLLLHNIWREPARRMGVTAPSAKAASRVAKTPTFDLFLRLLATTFERTHPSAPEDDRWAAPRAAALGLWRGEDALSTGMEAPSLLDLRDRAVLLWLVSTGLRADELCRVRARDLTTDGLLTVVGKGGRTRMLRVPAAALGALQSFQEALLPLATRRPRTRQKRSLAPLLEQTAPLFPSVRLWGRNAGRPERGLSRSGLCAMLARRARRAGIATGSSDWARCHGHGLRHLSAQIARSLGVDLPTIQAAFGHASLATTGIYSEERDPARICLVPDGIEPVPVRIPEE